MFSATTVFVLLQFVVGTNVEGRIAVAGTHDMVSVALVRLEKLGFPIAEIVARDGRFQFHDLAPGRYTIVVAAPGYETSSSEIQLPADSFALIQLREREVPIAPAPPSGQSVPLGQRLGRMFRKLFR